MPRVKRKSFCDDAQTKQTRFSCDECNYTCARQDHLVSHHRIHTDERPFACNEPGCSYASVQLGNLNTHKLTHSGQKPYACDWPGCSFRCSQSGHLNQHKRTHTNEKPFTCDFPGCSYTSAQSSNLATHKKIHEEKTHVCSWPDCSSLFTLKHQLEQHMRTHTGVRPFTCNWPGCTSAFVKSSHLTIHTRTHTGSTPYVCNFPECGYASTTNTNLKTHFKAKHTAEGQQRQKKSEQATADALTAAGIVFKREHRTTHECLGSTWSRTDFLIEVPGGVCDTENDEYQHDGYGVACEVARMMKIYNSRVLAGYSLPQMFVRFNPDAFRVDGEIVKGINKATRRQALVEFVKSVDLREAPPLQIVYLYYDAVTDDTGSLVAEVTQSSDFEETLVACTSWKAPEMSL